jgi:hypothetical protein
MRPAFHHAAAAALLATGLVASAWGQMQTPSGSTAPNGAQIPPSGTALPPGPPGVRANPGDPLPPPSEVAPRATEYAQTPGRSTPGDAMPGTPAVTTEQGGSRARAPDGTEPADVMHHDMNDMRNEANGSSSDVDGSRHHTNASRNGSTGAHHANRHTENAGFPRGLRQCADMVDREERARCASELYDENGQPRR